MFGFFRKRSLDSNESLRNEWQRLRDRFADPMLEHAETKQALIVSAASALDRLWRDNGHGWDASSETDFLGPLHEHLADERAFAPSMCAQIRQHLDVIRDVGRRNTAALAEAEKEAEEAGEEFDSIVAESADAHVEFIILQVIEYCRRFPEPIRLCDEEDYRGHY